LAARAVTVVEMHVWCQRCGAGLGAEFDALAQALSTHDIALTTPGAPGDASAGLVLFETVDSDVIDVLRDRSAGATVRVIAVHAGGVALPAAQHWNLLAAGAADVIAMPAAIDAAAACAARLRRWEQIDALMTSPLVSRNLVGASPAWCRVLRQVIEVASFTDASALIVGESGTGKELIARLIHTLDARREKGELVVLDCSTVVGDLAGSEFFGHERGAFTGATGPREGAFALADGGTLFLDEVGDIPLPLQVKLLRFLQERNFERIGGRKSIAVDVRVVCATHRNLNQMISDQTFRDDLYYRLAEVTVNIPSLIERTGDAVLLAKYFVSRFAREMNPSIKGMSTSAMSAIDQWQWPGNVRELENRIKRAVIMADGKFVTADDLDFGDEDDNELLLNLKAAREAADRKAIKRAISRTEGNISSAAKLLGISRPTLYDLLKQYDLQV
jgi:two-component system, NtrC family, response regulator